MTRHDDGLATAETAMALPALCVVVVALGCLLLAVTEQMRCLDGARAGARAAARGESDDVVHQRAAATAPGNATVTTSTSDGVSRVTVSSRLSFPGFTRLSSIVLSASALARDEADADADADADVDASTSSPVETVGS